MVTCPSTWKTMQAWKVYVSILVKEAKNNEEAVESLYKYFQSHLEWCFLA